MKFPLPLMRPLMRGGRGGLCMSLIETSPLHQSEFRLVLNLWENGNYNPNSVWINKILKRFLCEPTIPTDWTARKEFLHRRGAQPSEWLAPLGIIGDQLRTPQLNIEVALSYRGI